MKLQKRTVESGRLVRSTDAVRSVASETPKNVLSEHLSADSYAMIERGLRSTDAMTFLSAFMVLEPFLSPAAIQDLKAKPEIQTRVTQLLDAQIQADLPPTDYSGFNSQGEDDGLDVPRAETPEVLELCLRFNPELVNHPSFKRYQTQRMPTFGKEVVDHFVWHLTRPQPYRPNPGRLFNARLIFELAPQFQASILQVIHQYQLQEKIRHYVMTDKPLEKYIREIADVHLISPGLARTAIEQAMTRLPEVMSEIEADLKDGFADLKKVARYLEAVAIISARQASIDQSGKLRIVPNTPLDLSSAPLPDRSNM